MEDIFRKTYTPLDDEQKAQMVEVKELAEVLLNKMNSIVDPAQERSERARCMAIARTHLETAVMFAVKAVTTQKA